MGLKVLFILSWEPLTFVVKQDRTRNIYPHNIHHIKLKYFPREIEDPIDKSNQKHSKTNKVDNFNEFSENPKWSVQINIHLTHLATLCLRLGLLTTRFTEDSSTNKQTNKQTTFNEKHPSYTLVFLIINNKSESKLILEL